MQDIHSKNNQELSPQFIERVSSSQNSIRIRAIKHLSRSEMHQEKLQNIPLDLVSQAEHLAALRYIQTLWTLDYPFPIEIFFEVVQSVLAERFRCMELEEWDYLEKLDSSLILLFRRARLQEEYISSPKFFLLM
jgi:hypothetical protein